MQTATEIKYLLTIAAILLFDNWLIAPDVPDLVAAQKKEVAITNAESIAAAKSAAHEKAQRLRDAQLLDDANRMMYPCCQARAMQ